MRLQLPPEPWANNYERQADDAFNRATSMSDDQLRLLRPPLPQIEWLPPRFGYPDYVERQATVLQVFGINRVSPAGLPARAPKMYRDPADRVDYSGTQAGQNGGSPRNENYSPLGMGSS